jgi:hypothetical protein
VLEVVFILLEFLSPSRRIFIGSHSLPPLWFAVSVLQEWMMILVRSLSSSSSIKNTAGIIKEKGGNNIAEGFGI